MLLAASNMNKFETKSAKIFQKQQYLSVIFCHSALLIQMEFCEDD